MIKEYAREGEQELYTYNGHLAWIDIANDNSTLPLPPTPPPMTSRLRRQLWCRRGLVVPGPRAQFLVTAAPTRRTLPELCVST